MANPAGGYYPPAPTRKGLSTLAWVLIGIAGFILLAGMAVIGTGIYIAKRVADNPLSAAASVIAAANPDVELVSTDGDKGVVTFREKSTGQTVTLNLEDIKQGKLSFTSDDKEVHVEAGEGGIRVKSSDGDTAVIGDAQVRVPNWIPAYPGVQITGTISAVKAGKQSAMYGFSTDDPFRKVLDFYSEGLKKNGFTVETTAMVADKTAVLTGTSESPKRSAIINVSNAEGKTTVGVIFSEQE